jgi:NHL repeat
VRYRAKTSPAVALATIAIALLCAGSVQAKEIFDFFGGKGEQGGQFGSFPGGVALNTSGAGPANVGDVYVVDRANNRVERFGLEDNGTPSLKDDSYFFVSAWGADVAGPSGGSDYEVCSVATDCRKGVASGGNGTAAGNGSLDSPQGIAVDQDTGQVYVTDPGNNRVNVYGGDGVFLRSFGWDVVDSGPGQEAAPSERQEVTVKASGGKFSLSFKGATTGARGLGRPKVDNTVTEVTTTSGEFATGQAFTALLNDTSTYPAGTVITGIEGETLILSQPGSFSGGGPTHPLFGDDLDFDSSAAEVQAALNALPTIGGVGGSVTVTGGPGDGGGTSPYEIEFDGSFAQGGVRPLESSANGLTINSGKASAAIETTQEGGVYEVCVATDGDVCQAGSPGSGVGQVGEPTFAGFSKASSIAISSADGSPATGTVFLTDTGNHRISSYDLDGSNPGSFGSAAVFTDDESPNSVAVDSRGIVYANGEGAFSNAPIQRYDTENANGSGVGFLAPIARGVNEEQLLTIAATAGTFKLSFEGETTIDLPFDATADEFRTALGSLPAIGKGVDVVGGPGSANGSNPYMITFNNWLGAKGVPQITVSNGSVPLKKGAGATVVKIADGGPGANEEHWVTVNAAAGQFKLAVDTETTVDLPFNATSAEVVAALEALPSIGAGNVSASGGPGNVTGSSPYKITFGGTLAATNVKDIRTVAGTTPLSGGSGMSVLTKTQGQTGLIPGSGYTLAVDLDEDGGGPDTDVLYAARRFGLVQQLGPLNPPGLLAPPTVDDARHITLGVAGSGSIAAEPATGRLFLIHEAPLGPGVYLTGEAGPPPAVSLDSLSDVTDNSVTAHATINPNGPPDTSYHFEYSTDGVNWRSTPTALLGRQEDPQAITETIEPPLFGLQPGTLYHVRLVYQRLFSTAVTTPALTFTTDPAGPLAETTGSPLRKTTGLQLSGRVDPNNTTTSFHFEYGTEGPCSANPCVATPTRLAGSGGNFAVVAERLTGLASATTYHYRVLADNGTGGQVAGEDMTATTPASEAPLDHGRFPSAPGSDRDWGMVSVPDSGGNPAAAIDAFANRSFSSDGNRAIFSVTGGTPISETGSPAGQYLSRRIESIPHQGGWQTQLITPPRAGLVGPDWRNIQATDDLSSLVARNSGIGVAEQSVWRYGPGLAAEKLFEAVPPQHLPVEFWLQASSDGSVVAANIEGGALDPAYPKASAKLNLYEIGSGGAPQLLSLLPGETIATCGIEESSFVITNSARSLSLDGRYAYFPSKGAGPCNDAPATQLYVRDLVAEETRPVSAGALSGPECPAAFVRSLPGEAFFWTQTRLVGADSAPAGCSTASLAPDGDLYRYEAATDSLQCLTCVIGGGDADIAVSFNSGVPQAAGSIAVSDDGSRAYLRSTHALLPGAPEDESGVYRLALPGGELAYAGPISGSLSSLTATHDGAVLLFSSADPSLNPLGAGTTNGTTSQVYRYDDADHSLACLSCPFDGAAPAGALPSFGRIVLDEAGQTAAFATPTALVSGDQNSAGAGQDPKVGQDVYEWRDGRLLLVTDGLTDWSAGGPIATAISPSGRDLFFNAYAQYTPDALDAYQRVYDARIGGGFTYPKAPPPCPLEVCQGTPKGTPEERAPGTGSFVGPGNATVKPASCRKGKVRRRGRCVAKKPKAQQKRKSKSQAKHNGRASR